MTEQNPDRIGLVSLEEAAHLLGIASSTLKLWRRIKRLPVECVVRVSPRKYMYVELEIMKAAGQGDIYDSTIWRGKDDNICT